VPERFRSLRETPGHQTHVHDAKLPCTACHQVAARGFQTPGDSLCERCHDNVSTVHEPSILASSALTCQSCHGFGEDRHLRTNTCMRCHAAPQGLVAAVGLHAKSDCTSCHRPHESPSLAPTACVDCHKDQATVHAGKLDPAATCLDCHRMHDAADA